MFQQTQFTQQGGPNLLQQPGTVISNNLYAQTPGISPIQSANQSLMQRPVSMFQQAGFQTPQPLGGQQQGMGSLIGTGNQTMTGVLQQGVGLASQGIGLPQQGLGLTQQGLGFPSLGLGQNQQRQGIGIPQQQVGLTGMQNAQPSLLGQQQVGLQIQQPNQQLGLYGQTMQQAPQAQSLLQQQQQQLQQQQNQQSQIDLFPSKPIRFAGLPIQQQMVQQSMSGQQQANMLPQFQQYSSLQSSDQQLGQVIHAYIQNIYSQINPLDPRNRYKLMLYNMRNEFDPPIQTLQNYKQTFVSKYDNPQQQIYYCDPHLWQEAIKNNQYSLTNYPIQINTVKELFQRYEHTKQMRELQQLKEQELLKQIRSYQDYLQKELPIKAARSQQLSRDINEKFIRVNKVMEQILMAQGKYRKEVSIYNDVLKKNNELNREISGNVGLSEQINKIRDNLENIVLRRNTINMKDDLQIFRQINSQIHLELEKNTNAIKSFEDQIKKLI